MSLLVFDREADAQFPLVFLEELDIQEFLWYSNRFGTIMVKHI